MTFPETQEPRVAREIRIVLVSLAVVVLASLALWAAQVLPR